MLCMCVQCLIAGSSTELYKSTKSTTDVEYTREILEVFESVRLYVLINVSKKSV